VRDRLVLRHGSYMQPIQSAVQIARQRALQHIRDSRSTRKYCIDVC
jgi:hypothetical protein